MSEVDRLGLALEAEQAAMMAEALKGAVFAPGQWGQRLARLAMREMQGRASHGEGR